MLTQLLPILAPVFLCVGLGYVWARLKQPFDTRMVATLVLNVTTPCLVVATLSRMRPDPAALSAVTLAAAACFAVLIATGYLITRLAGVPTRAYLPALFLTNNGNVGLPICLFAFGDAGLALGIVYFVVSIVVQYTVGIAIISGHTQARALLRMPPVWSLIVGLPIMISGVALPAWIMNTLSLLGDMTIPIMLLALGVTLGRLRIGDLRRSLLLSAARLGVGVATGLGVAEAFGLTGVERGVVIVQTAMPIAIFAYLLAEYFDRQSEHVASLVLVSTLLTFAALPGILWLVL